MFSFAFVTYMVTLEQDYWGVTVHALNKSGYVDITAFYKGKTATCRVYIDHKPGNKATCESPQVCTGCRQELAPATGEHKYTWKTVKSATVFTNGKKEGTCSVCSRKTEEVINKLKPTIKLSAEKKTIKKGKYYSLVISKLAKGDSVSSVTSGKKSVASVKKIKKNKYKISGIKKGTATITVKLKSGKKAKIKVTVK